MFKSFSSVIAGFIAVFVGYTSSITIILQAMSQTNASSAEISSCLLALGFGMGVMSFGLSLYYRMPILIAWSTPGAVLLITSLSGISMPQAIGAFIFSSILTILVGVTGFFERISVHIPRTLAAAMLAGLLLHFCMSIFTAMQAQFLLVSVMFVVYLLGKQIFPRWVILLVLLSGLLIAKMQGILHLDHFELSFSLPVLMIPEFSWSKLIGIGIPLFVVTMTSQNLPGVAVLHASGYRPPISPIISWVGLANLLIAPFGGYALNLAAITAAICTGKEAHSDPAKRYLAAMYAGIFYFLVGLCGATIVTLFYSLPKELVLAIAGLALLGTLGSSLKSAVEEETQREPALITLLVTASGFTLFGIGAAFWGLVAGVVSMMSLSLLKKWDVAWIKNKKVALK